MLVTHLSSSVTSMEWNGLYEKSWANAMSCLEKIGQKFLTFTNSISPLPIQARNQLGTTEGKSILGGSQMFKLCPIVLNYVQHIFSMGDESILRGRRPSCAPTSYRPVPTPVEAFLQVFFPYSKLRRKRKRENRTQYGCTLYGIL